MNEVKPINDDTLEALKKLPGWPLHMWMAEMVARIESDRAEIRTLRNVGVTQAEEIDRLKAEVERLDQCVSDRDNLLDAEQARYEAGMVCNGSATCQCNFHADQRAEHPCPACHGTGRAR